MALARFFIPHLLISLCAICLHNGGWWPWTFFLGLSVLVTIGDRLCPRDHADLQGVNPRVPMPSSSPYGHCSLLWSHW